MGSWSDATGRRRVVAIEDLEMAAEEAGGLPAAEGEVEATQKARPGWQESRRISEQS